MRTSKLGTIISFKTHQRELLKTETHTFTHTKWSSKGYNKNFILTNFHSNLKNYTIVVVKKKRKGNTLTFRIIY